MASSQFFQLIMTVEIQVEFSTIFILEIEKESFQNFRYRRLFRIRSKDSALVPRFHSSIATR